MGYKLPNWAQRQIQQAAGLGELELTVALDDESRVVFQGVATRDRYLVEKKDGRVLHDKNEGRVVRSDRKRERPAVGDEGFL